jgi:amino acid transporter
MVDLTNIGTLFAFVLVCVGIPILRFRDPTRHRTFKVPFGPLLIPALGTLSCLFLMFYLPPASWWRFVGWLTLGLAVYASYSYSRSVLGQKCGRPERTPFLLKISAIGFLVAAIGMFLIPHDIGLVAREAETTGMVGHWRAITGVSMIGIGMLVGLAGAIGGTRPAGTIKPG